MFENLKKKREEQGQSPTSALLCIRVIIGGYLVYLGYDIITGTQTSPDLKILFGLAGGLFIFFGAFAAATGIREIWKGRFKGGFGELAGTAEETAAGEEIADAAENTLEAAGDGPLDNAGENSMEAVK